MAVFLLKYNTINANQRISNNKKIVSFFCWIYFTIQYIVVN